MTPHKRHSTRFARGLIHSRSAVALLDDAERRLHAVGDVVSYSPMPAGGRRPRTRPWRRWTPTRNWVGLDDRGDLGEGATQARASSVNAFRARSGATNGTLNAVLAHLPAVGSRAPASGQLSPRPDVARSSFAVHAPPTWTPRHQSQHPRGTLAGRPTRSPCGDYPAFAEMGAQSRTNAAQATWPLAESRSKRPARRDSSGDPRLRRHW